MADNPNRPLVALKVPKDILARLENFRFEHRFDTKTEAMTFLWEWALDHGATPPPREERQRARRSA